jgi:hypothetical protein
VEYNTIIFFKTTTLKITMKKILFILGLILPLTLSAQYKPTTTSTEPLLDRISVHMSAPQTTNVSIGDHIKYNTTSYTEGVGNITLDASSAYTATGNANSIGRFSLKAGYTYSLRAYAGFEFSTAAAAGAIVWRNADTGAEIGVRTQANNFSQGANINNSANIEVFFKPTIDTRVEVLLINAASITNIEKSWATIAQLPVR